MITKRLLILQMLTLSVALTGTTGCRMIGQTLSMALPLAIRLAPLKLAMMCIPEGTEVDTLQGPRPIESIRPGDTVIGYQGKPVRVLQVHGYIEDPETERFLAIEFENGATVRLCDMHRIGGIRGKDLGAGDQIAEQTVRSIEFFSGVERSYDLLTEDEGYRISGLPVNSMIEEMLEASKMGMESIQP